MKKPAHSKSMLGFLDFLGQTEESLAISYLYKTIDTIKKEKLFSLFAQFYNCGL